MKNLTLKSIKHMASLSEETNCYTADLYLDGVLIARVGNHGHGGCDFQHPVGGFDLDALNREIRETYPTEPNEFDPTLTMHQDIESICGNLLTDWLLVKDAKRWFKKSLVFIDGHAIREFKHKVPMTAEMEARARAACDAKYPGRPILNGLADAEIARLLRKADDEASAARRAA
jgi:hypothetical protein